VGPRQNPSAEDDDHRAKRDKCQPASTHLRSSLPGDSITPDPIWVLTTPPPAPSNPSSWTPSSHPSVTASLL